MGTLTKQRLLFKRKERKMSKPIGRVENVLKHHPCPVLFFLRIPGEKCGTFKNVNKHF